MPHEHLTPFDAPMGLDAWKTDADAAPDPGRVTVEEEDVRERCWWEFECACRDFARIEPDGWSAVLRAVARAMKEQQELVHRR